MVVDDTPDNIDVLRGVLRDRYKIKAAVNGEQALRIATKETQLKMVLLDIMMPGMDGYEVCRQLKANPATAKIPVIFITAKNQEADERKGLELGAVDYITKPISPSLVLARVRTHLALFNQNQLLEQKVRERTEELMDTRMEIIRRLGRAAEFKDNETGLHVIRMSHYSRLIAAVVERGDDWSELVFNAAPMHDIGKIGIPDRVLLKPGKLDEQEWALMRRHPEFGADILGRHGSELMHMAAEIALTHHEKWNGSGYPRGLGGTGIPLHGRIIAIADVFDALTTERPYKKAWSVERAVGLIEEEAGSHFDPELVEIFLALLPEVLKIKETFAEPAHSEPSE
nr:two-component system response regulator [Thiorhodococcus mannitoliphagus]